MCESDKSGQVEAREGIIMEEHMLEFWMDFQLDLTWKQKGKYSEGTWAASRALRRWMQGMDIFMNWLIIGKKHFMGLYLSKRWFIYI